MKPTKPASEFFFPVIITLVTLSTLLVYTQLRTNEIKPPETAVALVPLNYNSKLYDVSEDIIRILHSVIDNPTVYTQVIFFIDTTDTGAQKNFSSFLSLLKTFKPAPIIILGANMVAQNTDVDSVSDLAYGKTSITLNNSSQTDILKINTIPNAISEKNESKEEQFDWLLSLKNPKQSASILITQKALSAIDPEYQKIINELLCNANASAYVYMANRQSIILNSPCSKYSFDTFNKLSNGFSIIGLPILDQQKDVLRVLMLITKNNSIRAEDHAYRLSSGQ